MRITVLGNQHGWHTRQLEVAAKTANIQLTCCSYDQLAGRLSDHSSERIGNQDARSLTDGILLRAMGPSTLQQVVFRMDLLGRMVARGIRVVNSPRSIEWSIDKYLSLAMLQSSGVPIPKTEIVQLVLDDDDELDLERSLERVEPVFADWGSVVLKPLFGSEGRGLQLFNSTDELASYLKLVFADPQREIEKLRLGNVLYLQQFLPHQFDVRVLVIGEQTFAIKRIPQHGWISNVSQGATVEPFSLNDHERSLALSAARAVGGEFVGVDLMPVGDGWKVLEVNGAPGWRGIKKAYPNLDVPGKIFQLFESRPVG